MSEAKLTEAEIEAQLAGLDQWSRASDAIERAFTASTFREAQAKVNRICDLAEGAAHHPDISWTYTKLKIGLSTHDAGGLTRLDFRLAALVDDVLGG